MMIFRKTSRALFLMSLAASVFSCSGLEQSEQEKIKKLHAHAEPILRYAHETFHSISFPEKKERERYSWENTKAHQFPKITKEALRCKGSAKAQPKILKENSVLIDCQGSDKHSLPLFDDKEMVYPALLEMLNFLQDHLQKKVVVTAGHRCYAHQAYILGTTSGAVTKYLIGAQVDFLVEGISSWSGVVECLKKYFLQTYGEAEEYHLEKVASSLWQNKEISLKYFTKYEGRNEDNCHELPYFSLELRHDRAEDKKITVHYQQAIQGYYRF